MMESATTWGPSQAYLEKLNMNKVEMEMKNKMSSNIPVMSSF